MIVFLLLITAFTYSSAETLPENCEDIQFQAIRRLENVKSGIFKIYPTNLKSNGIEVFCDMETAGGGWIIIQRRENDSVDFYNDWASYVNGFGTLQGSIWLGLEVITGLTMVDHHVLRVDMVTEEGVDVYAQYEVFKIANSSKQYELAVSSYTGTAGDALTYHDGAKFSTKDNDLSSHNCSERATGAWWYTTDSCYRANLNGIYGESYGINWQPSNGHFLNGLKRVEMKIRTSCYSKFMQKNSL